MSLQLLEGRIEDIPDIVALQFAAYADPYHPYVAMNYPGLGSSDPEISKQGQHDATERLVKNWTESSSEYWLKVVDTETDKIVAISRWQIYKTNPFPNGPPYVEANFLPEGSRIREYCTFIMTDRLKRQAERCPMPNIWLNMMCTHPLHRRRGAASLMLQWAIDRGDKLDCEMFVEASLHGGQVYRNFGFIEIDELVTPKREDEEPDEGWKMLERTYPFTATWMWRPKQGVHAGKKA